MHASLVRRFASYLFGGALFAVPACDTGEASDTGASGAAGQASGGGSAGVAGSGSGAGAAGAPIGGAGATNGGAASGGGGAGAAAGAAGMGGAGGGAGGSGGSGGAGGSAGSGGSAGAGGSAGGGGGGMPAYNPCPTNGEACRVMPLGDSITDGYGSSTGAGYRLELFRLAVKAGKKLVFVGSHESGPDMLENMPFPKWQEGHSGWTIDDGGGRSGLYPKIADWLVNANPDKKLPHVITLMIGTNDVDLQLDLATAPDRLGKLLDRIIMTAPDALLFVAPIVPTKDDGENTRVQAYNSAIPALVKSRADAGKHIALVDMYGAFTKNANYKTQYMGDNLHPNDTGYSAMASTWYEKVGPLLK